MDICDSYSEERNRNHYPKNVLHIPLQNTIRELPHFSSLRHLNSNVLNSKSFRIKVSQKTRKEFIKTNGNLTERIARCNYAANGERGSNL